MAIARSSSTAPLAVVWGHLKVFVNDVTHFELVVGVLAARTLPLPEKHTPSEPSAVVATAEMVQARLSAHRGRNHATLAKVVADFRGTLSGPLLRKLDLLNKGASVVRHTMVVDTSLLSLLDAELIVSTQEDDFSPLVPAEVVGHRCPVVSGQSLVGDWRALPAHGWTELHRKFLQHPHRIAGEYRLAAERGGMKGLYTGDADVEVIEKVAEYPGLQELMNCMQLRADELVECRSNIENIQGRLRMLPPQAVSDDSGLRELVYRGMDELAQLEAAFLTARAQVTDLLESFSCQSAQAEVVASARTQLVSLSQRAGLFQRSSSPRPTTKNKRPKAHTAKKKRHD